MPKIGDIKKDSRSRKYNYLACIDCGKERWVMIAKGKPRSLRCKSCSKKDKNHPNFGKIGINFGKFGKSHSAWKGGRFKDSIGYIYIWVDKDSPFAKMRSHQGYILEHRLVMARYLGSSLTKEEVVHHNNEIVDDNRIENLKLFKNQGEHTAFHHKLRRD